MARIELRPGEGGVDAQGFAVDLASAIGKYSGVKPVAEGSALVLYRL